MSVRTDVINLNVNVNGNTAQNQLNELKKKAADTKLEMEGLTKGTQAFIDKKADIKKINEEMDGLKRQIGLTALTQKELNQELLKLKSLKGSVTPFTEEFKNLQKQIETVESRLYDVKNGVQGFASFFSKIKDEVKQFGVAAAAYLGFEFITSQFSNIINGAGKLSDSLADVRKSTGLTTEEVDGLNKNLKEFDTRTANQSLRDLAVDAGKLGIEGKNNILDFIAAGDQINVALGEDLGKDAVKDIGKLVDIFRTKEEFGLKESMLKVGSAINDVGANSSAAEAYIVDFLKRMGGIGPAAKIPLPDLIALAGTMDSLGQTSESSTTAIGNTISKLVTDFDGFARIAGITGEKLKQTFNDKGGLAALQQVLEGVKKSGGNFDELVAKLGDVGIEGAKAKGVFAVLANNLDVLDKQMKVSGQSYEKGISLTNEFNIKNQTFGATLDKLGKEFNSLLTAPGVTNFLKSAADSTYNFIQFLKDLPKWLEENRTSLIILTGVILTYVAAKTRAAQSTLLARAATLLETAADKIEAVQKAVNTALTTAYAYAKDILTGKIKIATVAQQLWNLALKANPLGVIIVLITAVAAAISFLAKKYTELNEVQKLQRDIQTKAAQSTADEEAKLRSLSLVVGNSAVSLEARKKALQELIAINPQYLSGLTLENIKSQEGINIINNYVKALREKATIQAATDAQAEKIKQDIKLQSVEQSLERKIGTGKTDLNDLSKEEQGYVGSARKQFNFTASVTDLATGDNAAKEALQQIKAQRAKIQVELDITDGIIAKKYEETVGKINKGSASTVAAGEVENKKSVEVRRKFLEGQIKSLEDAYGKLNYTDTSGLKANTAQRKKLQEELDTLNGKDAKKTSGEKKDDQTLKQAQEFYKKLQELKYHAEEAAKSKDQQEIDNVKHKYVELLKEYDHFAAGLKGKSKSIIGDRSEITKAEQAELNALGEKQRKVAFEKEQKEIKDNLSKAYTSQQQSTQVFYEDQKNKQAQRFVNGEISKADYEANIRQVDIQSKQDQLQAAEEFSKLTVTIEGKMVPAAEQAAKDVTRLKKEQLDKQTNDLVKSLEDQKAERALMEDLRNSGKEAVIQTKIAVAYSKKDNDAYFAAQKDLADHQRQMKSDALEREADDERAKLSSNGAEREGAELLIRTNLRQKLEQVDAEFDAAEKQIDADKIAAKVDGVMKYVDAYMTAASSLSNFLNTLDNRQLQNEVNRNNRKKAEYKKQLDSKLLSQEQYNLKTQKLDDESEAKKKEIARQQAKRDKALNIFSAIVNTSAAIIKMLADPGGFAGVALSIAAGITGLAQIGSIIATPLPELGTGGLLDSGPYHREKERGLHVVDPRTGQTKMLLEKDEAVLTGRAMRSNDQLTVTGTPSQIASRINSRYGGVSWAGGAVVDMPKWRTERPVYINPNMPRIMEQGGLIRPIDGNTNGATDNAETNGLLRQLIAKQDENTQEIKTMKTKLHAIVAIRDIDDTRAKYDHAKKASGLNQ